MAERDWEVLKVKYCERIGCDVNLEVERIIPAEYLGEQPPRLVSHRCSRGRECMMFEQVSCIWSGSNSVVDPFQDQ